LRPGLQTEIDIFKTILNIRKQRSGFVQTDLQYKFIYIAVKRYVELKKKPTALPSPVSCHNADDARIGNYTLSVAEKYRLFNRLQLKSN